jgi:nucleoside-diphosphate-sugar epimerase
VRDPRKASPLAALGVTLVEGDLNNPSALHQLVSDCDIVIHGAGAVRGSSQQAFDQVNVTGTATLLAAIKSQPNQPRFLLLSSLAAREPGLSWYAHSKRDGEKLLEPEAGLDWVILRPPAVYGPGDKEMLPIFQWMGRGIAFVPGSTEARISLIHVNDLVDAIIACLNAIDITQKTLTLCDGKSDGYNWRELADIAGIVYGRRVRLWRVPPWLLNSISRLNVTIAGVTGGAPMLTPPKLRELRHHDWVVDNAAITAACGWTPSTGLRNGLQQLTNPAL